MVQTRVVEMRGKSSSRVKDMKVMESPSSKPKEEPRLSGAYIRSLVKHLSASRPKEHTMNPRSPDSTLESPPPPAPPPQPKKQVRRRLHTSRPYQERLLNMAEARREIVTALKYHRASMKQANEQHQHQLPPNPDPNPSIYEASIPTLGYPHMSSRGSELLIARDATCIERGPQLATPFHHDMWQSSTSWSYPTLAPLPDISMELNLPLPKQPLGLNLSFHGFNNIDTPLYNSSDKKEPPIQPLSPPHSSSSSSSSHSNLDMKMHVAVGEKEMEEIRSIGEMHDIEWNDTMNLVTSAWWSKFVEMMEADPREANDIPAWLKDGSGGEASANYLGMKKLDEWYLQDASLPCMDIEEIEWLDGEWLS